MAGWNETLLKQKWTHSFEEDTAEEWVYRPEGFTLAAARGRLKLDLKEHGELLQTPIGKGDVPSVVKGTWKLEGNQLILQSGEEDAHQYQLKEVTTDKLVLKK